MECNHGGLEHRKIVLTKLSLQVSSEAFISSCKFVKPRGKRVEEWKCGFDMYWCHRKRIVKGIVFFAQWQCSGCHVARHAGRHGISR